MKDKLLLIQKHLKQGTLRKMWAQSKWILQYGRRYWKSHGSLYASRNRGVRCLPDFQPDLQGSGGYYHRPSDRKASGYFCRHDRLFPGEHSRCLRPPGYASTFINLKVDSEIKNDIFVKMLVTDWESLTAYHTGDLVTRWSSDASNISNGILNWLPNLIIYTFRFVSALAVVLYYDPTFALFALLGIPFSALLSRPLLRRMRNNNQKSAAMNAKMYGFNQEAFSNIQTIKAFDLIRFYTDRLKSLQTEYIRMRLDFQKMSILTSVLMSIIGFIVSYSCYGWGIYRVWSNAISYGTMTMFLSLSGTLTSSVNSLASLIPTAISLTISAGRLMDIVEMPQEDYSQDSAVEKFGKQHRQEGIGLIMKDLDYTYRTGTNVFSGASMEAYPHEIVALVGPSGEGKTTMLRLILSLLKPQKGSFHICAGHNEKEQLAMSPSTRKLFSYVPQGNTMFSGTIAENLRNVKPDATDEEIIEALKLACAWEFVEKLPDRIESEVKERGGGFSEGQAQRLSIAGPPSEIPDSSSGRGHLSSGCRHREKSPEKYHAGHLPQNLHRHDPPPHRAEYLQPGLCHPR